MVEVIAVFCVFGLPVIAFIISRVLKHQERIEMIRRGMMPSAPGDTAMWDSFARMNQSAPKAPPSQPRTAASEQHFDANTAYGYQAYMAAQNQLRKGITLGMIGLALFIGLSFIDLGRPGPWLLGGLIPMFVGIAQILIAMMSGARFQFGAPGPAAGYQVPPVSNSSAPGPQPSQPRDVTPGSYAYRPGNTTELEPPAGPPDKRF